MAEIEQETDRKRSPNYPSISLLQAVSRLSKLYTKIGINAGTKEVLAAEWDTTAKSSSFLQAIASLGKYGLLIAMAGTPRKFKLSRDALDIVMLPATDPKHVAAIKRAALVPTLFRDLWEEHGADIVSDDDLKHLLVTKHEFRPDAAADVVRQYRRNIEFANLGDADRIPTDNQDIEVGDLIQWAQFPEPLPVTGKSSDGTHVFVDGSQSGLPVDQIRKIEPTNGSPTMTPQPQSPLAGVAPPINPNYKPSAIVAALTGVKEYGLTVDTGQVIVRWPETLSEEDFETIEGWIDGLKRKIRRSVKSTEGTTET